MPEAVFRFDASTDLGFGHAMRCSAIADHLGALGWRTTAAVREDRRPQGPWLRAFDRVVPLAADGDEPDALRAVAGEVCDLLVVDHYGWDWQKEGNCRQWAKTLAVIDDLADRDHSCDVLCDSGPDRQSEDYAGRVPAGARLLLGPDYALLRSEFAKARHRLRSAAKARVERIFVNVGATDPNGRLPVILDGIEQSGFDGVVDIVVAAQAPGRRILEEKLANVRYDCRLHVDTQQVAELMANADLAIGAAGISAWERCCLRLPSLVVVAAENQRHVAQGLASAGAAKLLDRGLTADHLKSILLPLLGDGAERHEMARLAGRICDGLGCGRFAEATLFPATDKSGAPVRLRPVNEGDLDILLQWQSEPGTRHFARDPRVPDYAEHSAWFLARLDDPGCVFHVIEVAEAPAGFVRLDFRPETESYEVSVVVGRAFRGRGIASTALGMIRRMLPWAELHAWIQPENAASISLFRKAGYEAGIEQGPAGCWYVSRPRSQGHSCQPALVGGVSS